MDHTSYLEISKSAYSNNIKFIKSQIGENVTISSVIKGNAYGHGIENIVKIAESVGIRHFSAFSTNEAIRVRNSSTKKSQIMIMGMVENESLPYLIEHEISFYVFEMDRLTAAIEESKALGKKAMLHIEVETGFHRTGFDWKDKEMLLETLKENSDHIQLCGLCTHYAGAESVANYLRIQSQIKSYHEFKEWFNANDIHFDRYHTACSAATFSYPETIMDMVRIGIAQYGFWPSQETYMFKFKQLAANKKNPLKRLISWKSKIMSLKKIKIGDYIGYGNSYLAVRDMTIAQIPIGYCNGFGRSLSNLGNILIHGKVLSVVANVTMNTISVDVTDLKGVKKGDEVVIIGRQKRNEITVASFGESTQQVNYELLTRLPNDIPRKIVT